MDSLLCFIVKLLFLLQGNSPPEQLIFVVGLHVLHFLAPIVEVGDYLALGPLGYRWALPMKTSTLTNIINLYYLLSPTRDTPKMREN